MRLLSRGRRPFFNFHRLLAVGGAMVLVLLSCGREPTTGPMHAPGGVARGLSFNTVFPKIPHVAAFASIIEFTRVRVLLHHPDGSVALDTLVPFPTGVDAITLSFDVTLAPGTPAAGELLALNLAYLNAAGDTVFKGGPVDVRAAVSVVGAPPPVPVTIPVGYSGPGHTAKTLKISPRSLTVNAGAPFVFTAIASDSNGASVGDAPIAWGTPDSTLAAFPDPKVGSGTANASRGTARVIAQLFNGAADTVTLNVIPTATAIAVASGNNQSGVIGKPTLQALAQPIAVRVTAADGLGVAGVSVAFAAANGGSVGAATVVTDAAGLAQTAWSLGASATAQTATATVAGLAVATVTFNATGAAKPATKLVLMSGPAANADIPSGSPTPLVVAAQDVDGDPAVFFTGDIAVALSTNPASGTLAGTSTVTAVGGVASFPALSIAKPGIGYVLQATSGTLAPVSTNAFNIVTGPAANIALVSGGAQTAEAGAPLQPVKVLVTDVNGNPKSGATVAFAAGATFGTVTPASVVTAPDGTATVVWTLGATLGAQTMTATTGSVPPLTVNATAVAVVRTWVITQQPPATAPAGSPMTGTIKAELRDAFNVVVPSFTGATTIAIGTNPGNSALGGTLTVNAVTGVATFSGLTLNKSGNGYTLLISSPSTTQATSNAFNITPAAATTVAIISGNGQSGTVGAALTAPVVALVSDAFGNPVPGASVSFTPTAGGGSASPATATTDASGHVSTTWTLGSTSAAQTLAIGGTGLTTVSATASAASPTRTLVITQQPSNAQAGAAISPTFTVEVHDGFNAVVPTFTGPVTVVIGNNPGSAKVSGTTTVNAVAGVAAFTGISIGQAAVGYTLVASTTGASDVASTTFNVTAGTATTLAIASGGGQTGASGAALPTPIVVSLTDAYGNGIAGANVSVAVTSGGGSVSPTTGTTDAAGHFSTTWTLGTASASQSVTVSRAGLTSVVATATATSAVRVLAFAQQPGATQTAGVAIAPAMTVEMHDGFGAVVPSFTGPVALALGANCCGATISGTVTVNAVAGVASFSGISLDKRGGGYTFVASATGATSGTSTSFVVSPAGAKSVSVASGAGQSGAAGAALSSPIVGFVVDAFGNGVAGVPVTVRAATGGGSVTPTSGATDSTGRISATWTLGTTATSQRLDFVVTGVDSASASATATSGVTLSWTLTTPPASTQTAGANITPAIVAELRDGAGAVVTSFTGTATLYPKGGPTSVLNGTKSVAASNGVVTFSSVNLTQTGTYYLELSAPGTQDFSTGTFTVGPAAASGIAVASGASQTGTFAAMLGAPVVLKVTDTYGNPVAGKAVTFAVASGGGSVGTPSATTDANGLASTTWTLGPQGTQTITATSSGLTGSPVTIGAVVTAGSIATTVLSPRNDTLTSLGATVALTAQSHDVTGGNLNGSFGWASRDNSVASVSSGGVVTAVANGSTYIVVSEVGGTRDSALVVVQQRTATINVTPGSRSLYVTGLFAYTASAVDGRGNAMATQPTFTWSSTSPSVASVNSSTGAVTALAIGTTQIRATAGSIIGVSPLSVLTPIKRIVVSIDTGSVAATVPDTFTMAALGIRRGYRAVARDTIDNVMTGVTFTWASTNASVAGIDSSSGAKASATSAANGITSIQASAQGVIGSASLNVAQVLTSIELSPATATVFVGGNTPLVARGKDSNGRYISGGNFTYASSGPAFGSVNATSGVVTGVALGTTNITATSGAITSNISAVTVSNEVGAYIISFGRDTIGVGRGTSISVPILLSRPISSPLVVTLAATDTNAYWSTSTITIPANQTAVSATLNGRNAGTTHISATDGTSVYTSASAVVAVQANMHLTTTYYSMNQTDQKPTQVVLSDPSPAGGTYVTFSYGAPNVAQVSPDPAFIPAGQLAADIVIRGIGAGNTSLTPLATGVSGTGATVNVSAAVLNISATTLRLGAGQYEPYIYLQVPNYVANPLTVALTTSDSSVATTAPSITIPASNYYAYFEVHGVNIGTASVISTALGWTPDTLYVTTTTPRLTVCCSYTLNSTAPAQTLTIYTADSTGSAHARLSSLAVRVTSSDTTVMKVLDSLVTVTAGSYYSNTARIIPGGAGGSAWIRVSAGGHMPDSVQYTVVGPALTFGAVSTQLGVGQTDQYMYVSIPNAIATPLVITLGNSDSTFVATDASVTIPSGQTYAYFPVRGRGVGTSTIIGSASGYIPDTLTTTVTAPGLRVYGGGTLNAYSSYTTNVYTIDANGTSHNRLTDLTVSIRSSDPSVLSADTSVVIPAGSYYAPTGIQLQALKGGTVTLYVTAPGHAPDSTTWTVVPARVNLSWLTTEIGARQHLNNSVYVYIPNSRATTVPVTLTHSNPAVVSFSTLTPTIPASNNYVYFDFAGLVTGVDTVVATASGYLADTAYIRVSPPRFLVGSFPTSGTTTNPPASVLLYVADSSGNVHYANDSVVVHAVSSDPTVVKPVADYFRIAKDSYYSYTGYQFVGPGTATITYSDSAASGYVSVTSNPVTVTGPSLQVGGTSGMLGTGQHTFPNSYYVSVPNTIGTPLTVRLVSTDPRVASVDTTVTIPAGQYYAYFTVTAHDTVGTVQIQATATGYSPSSTNMQVTQGRLFVSTPTGAYTTSPSSQLVVYAEDASSNTHPVNADIVVSLLSSQPGVAGIDSTTVTIPAGAYYVTSAHWTPGSAGTAQLTATDNRAIQYPYLQGSANVTVSVPAMSLGFSSASVGIGQYFDTYVSIPVYTTSPLVVALNHAGTPTTSTPTTDTIPQSNSYQYFRVTGTTAGTDTITSAAAGYTSAVGTVTVGKGLIGGVTYWPTALKAGDSTAVVLYLRSPDGSTGRPVASETTFDLAADANVTFSSGGANATAITSVVIPANSSSVTFYIKGGPTTGTANITVSNANYVTYSNSVAITP